jgi:type I restriction enzyme R subunit
MADPAFLSLKEELERLFRKKNLAEITQAEMIAHIGTLREIDARARDLERRNQLLRAKYANDAKYARLHKRLLEKGDPTDERAQALRGAQRPQGRGRRPHLAECPHPHERGLSPPPR